MIAKPWTLYVCRSLDEFDWFVKAIEYEIKEDEHMYLWSHRDEAVDNLNATGCVMIELDEDMDTYFSSLNFYNRNKEYYDLIEVSSLMPIVISDAIFNELLGVS